MLFKAAMIALAVVSTIATGLYLYTGHLSDKLEAAEIRAQNAAADLSLAKAALDAQSQHTARVEALVRELAAIEDDINEREGADAPLDPATLAFLRSIGLLAN